MIRKKTICNLIFAIYNIFFLSLSLHANTTLLIDNFDDGSDPLEIEAGSTSNTCWNTATPVYTQESRFGNTGYSYKLVVSGNDGGAIISWPTPKNFSQYKALTFRVKGSATNADCRINLEDNNGGGPATDKRPFIGNFLQYGVQTYWQKVTIPVCSLCYDEDSTAITKLVFLEDNRDGTIYLDDFALVSAASPVWIDNFDDSNTTSNFNTDWSDWWGTDGQLISTQFVSSPCAYNVYITGANGARYVELPSYDISGGDSSQMNLKFNVKGKITTTPVEGWLIDIPGADENKVVIVGNGNNLIDGEDTITDDIWRTAIIPLTHSEWQDAPSPDNFTDVQRFGIYMAAWGDSIIIDNIRIQDDSYPATPYNLKDDTQTISNSHIFDSWNILTCNAAKESSDSTLHYVWFEYSYDNTTWYRISNEYDCSDETYSFIWYDTGISETMAFSIRAVAEDVTGNTSASSTFSNCYYDRTNPSMISALITSATTILVYLNEDISASTLSSSQFKVNGISISSVSEIQPGVLQLTLSTPISLSETASIYHTGGLSDLASNVSTEDTIASSVVSTLSLAIIANQTTVYIYFNLPVDSNSLDSSDFKINNDTVTSAVWIDSYTVRLTYTGLNFGESAQVSIVSTILDSDGDTIPQTSVTGSWTIIPASGGTIRCYADSATYVTFPAGAASEPLVIIIAVDTSFSNILSYDFKAYKYSNGSEVKNFFSPVTIVIHYYDHNTDGFVDVVGNVPLTEAASKLGMYYYDNGQWIFVSNNVNTQTQSITGTVNHFTLFAIQELTGITGQFRFLTGIINPEPNPFTPNGDGINDRARWHFENISSGVVTLKIFNLRGQLVDELTSTGATEIEWDGKNRSGNPAKSGVYIYRLEGPGQTHTGTIVLAR
ncbi:MAG: gliding motility-associated C-terminal domain-containing protein [Candidatus Hydrogenedentota bacterium]